MYLQVHVINNPAYEVLLGRPFDVLTKTISEMLTYSISYSYKVPLGMESLFLATSSCVFCRSYPALKTVSFSCTRSLLY